MYNKQINRMVKTQFYFGQVAFSIVVTLLILIQEQHSQISWINC